MNDNKLIHKFVKFRIDKGYNPTMMLNIVFKPSELLYDKSWSWLMPVVDEIINRTHISSFDPSLVRHQENQAKKMIFDAMFTINIKHIHQAVVNFIKWYNKNNK